MPGFLRTPVLERPQGAPGERAAALVPERRCSCNGLSIHYRERGQGRTLLLVHGFGASSFSWRHLLDGLSGELRVIAPDLKGFGLSDKPDDGRYSATDQASILTALLRELGLQEVILGGHSFGGTVVLLTALELLRKRDALLRGLLLVDAAAYTQKMPWFFRILRTPGLNRAALALLPGSALVRGLLRRSFADPQQASPELISAYSAPLGLPGARRAAITTATQMIPRNAQGLIARYPKLDLPAQVLWGAQDRITPISNGRRLAKDLPQAELTILEDCGHMPQEEWPGRTVETVRRFLERL